MGYTLSVPVSSDTLRHNLHKFLKTNYKRLFKRSNPSSGDFWESDSGVISISYRSGLFGVERIYVYSVVRWIAIMFGDKRSGSFGDPSEPYITEAEIPHYIYDCEAPSNPVLVTTVDQVPSFPEGHRGWCVDEFGVNIDPEVFESFVMDWALADPVVSAEFLKKMNRIGRTSPKRTEQYVALCSEYYAETVRRDLEAIRCEVSRLREIWEDLAIAV